MSASDPAIEHRSAGRRAPEKRPPWRRNLLIGVALMGLLFLSLGIAYLPWGRTTTILGLLIALAKASLVASLYMELDRASALIRLCVMAGGLFVAVLFGLTFTDILTRL